MDAFGPPLPTLTLSAQARSGKGKRNLGPGIREMDSSSAPFSKELVVLDRFLSSLLTAFWLQKGARDTEGEAVFLMVSGRTSTASQPIPKDMWADLRATGCKCHALCHFSCCRIF